MEKFKKELAERFTRLYKGCTLFAVQLNGFSHTLFYKDKVGKKYVAVYSAYASEQYEEDKEYSDGIIRSINTDRIKLFFVGIGHSVYKSYEKEFVYQPVSEWEKNKKKGKK